MGIQEYLQEATGKGALSFSGTCSCMEKKLLKG